MKRKQTNGGYISQIVSIIVLILIIIFLSRNSTVKYFWHSFVSNMQRMHNGQPNDWQLAAPIIPFNR
ncbi:MAG: hypothetical protein NT068_01160 [Candidatus Nomurabacteria bacterium]|nr:hypothetical protein [Candidatus Nomurabacteria bacterium]